MSETPQEKQELDDLRIVQTAIYHRLQQRPFEMLPVRLQPHELRPDARARYEEFARTAPGSPIYVMSGLGIAAGEMEPVELDGGRQAVLVDRESWWMTRERLLSAASTPEHLASLSIPASKTLMEAYQQMARQRGIEPPPALYRGIYDKYDATGPHAGIDRNGNPYISIHNGIPDKEAIAIAAHELGHVEQLDRKRYADSMVEQINARDRAADIESERRSDQTAVELCKGDDLARVLMDMHLEKTYNSRYLIGKTQTQREIESTRSAHPLTLERIHALRDGHRLQVAHGACAPPDTPSPTPNATDADKNRGR